MSNKMAPEVSGSKPGLYDYGLLVILASIFSSAFVWIALALPSFPPATVVLLRQGIAAAIFLIVLIWAGQKLPAWGSVWLPICGIALLGNALPFFLVSWGQETVDAGLAAILISATPIWALLIGQLFTREYAMTVHRILAAVIGFAGVITLIGWENLFQLGDDQLRQYAILGGALSYGFNAYVTKYLSDQPRLPIITAGMIVSVFMMLPFSIAFDQPWTLEIEPIAIIAVLLLAILSTVVGNWLRFEIAGRRGPLFLTQISYLIPLFGLFWAWLILSEVPTARVYVATGLILAGIAIFRWGEKPSGGGELENENV